MRKILEAIKLLFIFTIFLSSSHAQNNVQPLDQLISIDNLLITNVINNKIELKINSVVNRSGKARMQLYSSNAKINQFENSVVVEKGVEHSTNFTLIVNNNQNTMVSIHYEFENVLAGYEKSYSKHFKIIKVSDQFHVFDPIGENSLKIHPKDIDLSEFNHSDGSKTQNNKNQTYNISISGKMLINFMNKGVYDNGVALYFRNSSNPDNWYHPLVGNQQNIHYDILDEQGNFNFSFNGDLSGYNEVLVLLNTANSAAYLPAPADGYNVYTNNGIKTYFNESEGVCVSFDGNNSNINIYQIGKVNQLSGEVLRYLTLSREFIIELYNGNVPFSIAPVSTKISGDTPGGLFSVHWTPTGYIHFITINPISTDLTTVAHEYGHFLHFSMWGRPNYVGCANDLQEGWATFNAFAVRNYSNKKYNDELLLWDANTENAPYSYPYRYANMRKGPYISAIACYLWDLYDNSNSNLLESDYYLGDNDDITGYSTYVFETMRTFDYSYPTYLNNFHESFIQGLSSNEEISSANSIMTFMFSDLNSIPNLNKTSVQVKSFSKQLLSATQVKFTWNSQSYGNQVDYGNYETGYKLYYKNGGNWLQIATIPYGQNEYTYSSSDICKEFKITAYNNNGESSKPPSLIISPTTPIISSLIQNPNPICKGSAGYVTSNLQQGNGNLSYSWTAVSLPSDAYITPMGNKCKITYPNSTSTKENNNSNKAPVYEISCTVTNSAGTHTKIMTPVFSSSCGGCPTLAFENNGYIEDENPILTKSISSNSDVVDNYLINKEIDSNRESIDFLIHEPSEEHTYLDKVELLEVELEEDEFAAVSEDGEIVNYSLDDAKIQFIYHNKSNVGNALYFYDDKTIAFNEGDQLQIDFGAAKSNRSEGESYLLLAGKKPPIKEQKVATLKTGSSKTNNEIFLRPNNSILGIKLPQTKSSLLDIEFHQNAEIDYIAIVKDKNTAVINELSLLSAIKNDSIYVEDEILNTDQVYCEIYPNDKVRFSFERNSSSTKKKAYVLRSTGRYEEMVNSKMAKTTGIQNSNENLIPKEAKLFENYPNPFNPSTTIKYAIPMNSHVSLVVYSILGEKIFELVNEIKMAGTYSVNFDASNLPSGTYIYRIKAGDFTETKKMILLK